MDTKKKQLTKIQDILINGSPQRVRAVIRKFHKADLADALEDLTHEQRINFFKKVKPELVADIFEEIENPVQVEVIQEVSHDQATTLVENLDLDNATDLMQDLQEEDKAKATKIINALTDHDEVVELMKYGENSAGGIMNPEFIAIPQNLTVKEAISYFKKCNPPDKDFSYYIYITNDKGLLKGITSLRDLILAKPTQMVKDLRKENIISVPTDMDQEEVAGIISKYDLLAIPVTDKKEHIVGIITVDDIVDVIREEATEDILKLSGVGGEVDEDEILTGNIFSAAFSRFKWLFLTMFGGLLSGSILATFAKTYGAQPVFLSIMIGFVPLLVGLGGNIGNQSATIMVRGIATGYLKNKDTLKSIFHEITIGAIIGIGIGLLILVGTWLIYDTTYYGIMVSTAIMLNLTISAALGTTLPIIFTKMKIDPAIASAPFISSTIDVVGLLIYFIVIKYFHIFFQIPF